MEKRKHRVVVDVTFNKKVNEKRAAQLLGMLIDDAPELKWRPIDFQDTCAVKFSAKQFSRVFHAEFSNFKIKAWRNLAPNKDFIPRKEKSK